MPRWSGQTRGFSPSFPKEGLKVKVVEPCCIHTMENTITTTTNQSQIPNGWVLCLSDNKVNTQGVQLGLNVSCHINPNRHSVHIRAQRNLYL